MRSAPAGSLLALALMLGVSNLASAQDTQPASSPTLDEPSSQSDLYDATSGATPTARPAVEPRAEPAAASSSSQPASQPSPDEHAAASQPAVPLAGGEPPAVASQRTAPPVARRAAPEQDIATAQPSAAAGLRWPAWIVAGAGAAGLAGAAVLGAVAVGSWSDYLDDRTSIQSAGGADYTVAGLQRIYFAAQAWTVAAAGVAVLGAGALAGGLAWALPELLDDARSEGTP